MSQLATSMNQLKGNNGALPSQVHVNPKENVNKITLRSGTDWHKGFSRSAGRTARLAKQSKGPTAEQKGKGATLESNEEEQTKVSKPLSLHDPKAATSVPFPGRLARKKPEEELIDFVKIFGKLEVNLPFLQALKIPPFGKFVKDFIAGKSKATGKIVMGENVQLHSRRSCPPNAKILSGHQLADRSCVYPEGLLENVLVSVNNFVYPADFYVVRMSGVQSKGSTGVLLGRPFLRTAKSIIDVSNGTICLDYHGEKYTFSMDDAMKTPNDAENAYSIDVIDPLVQEFLETEFMQDKLELTMIKSWTDFDAQGMNDAEVKEAIMSLYAQPEVVSSGSQFCLPKQTPYDRPLRSDEKPPELELNLYLRI
ncbi:uncharacterized protein LOC131023431 [Salvia miltiorrhiza]|uniref:uncharacterized protein LOC131023431 n=1 Tax=Salvia miltiorrhiza TaxID=226208 RepID=UPI0025AB620D|nr:uncharacterized protein LOC131023431 [Salvia miltiorrhiza]